MDFLSRRMFLKQGSVAVALAGVAASTSLPVLSEAAANPRLAQAAADLPESGQIAQMLEPVVAHVNDLATGEINLFVGNRQIVLNDPGLAHAIVRASQ